MILKKFIGNNTILNNLFLFLYSLIININIKTKSIIDEIESNLRDNEIFDEGIDNFLTIFIKIKNQILNLKYYFILNIYPITF